MSKLRIENKENPEKPFYISNLDIGDVFQFADCCKELGIRVHVPHQESYYAWMNLENGRVHYAAFDCKVVRQNAVLTVSREDGGAS